MSCWKHNPLVKGMSLQNKNFIVMTLQRQQQEKKEALFLHVISPDVLGVTERTPQIRTPQFTGTVLGHHSCHRFGNVTDQHPWDGEGWGGRRHQGTNGASKRFPVSQQSPGFCTSAPFPRVHSPPRQGILQNPCHGNGDEFSFKSISKWATSTWDSPLELYSQISYGEAALWTSSTLWGGNCWLQWWRWHRIDPRPPW